MLRPYAVAGLLVVAVLAAHGGALHGGFHYDDSSAITENPAIRTWRPMEYIVSGYRPMAVLSFALNYQLGGLTPRGYLLTNLGLHALASVLVFLLAREVLGDLRWAAVSGALFALHPINAESVNYATARFSLLATVGAVAAAWAFIRYAERRDGPWTLVIGLGAFAAALLSKESAVALAVPLLAARWLLPSLRRQNTRLVVAASAYSAVVVLFLAWHLILGAGYDGESVGTREPAPRPFWTFTEMVARSLALWVWPSPLGLDHRLTFLLRFDARLAAALVVGAVALAAVFVILARRAPAAAWGLLWALAGLAPLAPLPWITAVGLLQENRMGFSAAGLALTTASLAGAAWMRFGRARFGRALRWSVVGAGVVLAVAAVVVDRSRSVVWQDDRRLWQEVVDRSPENVLAHLNLGAANMAQGEYALAEAEFRAIQRVLPDYPRVYYLIGLLAERRGRADEAKAAFERAIALHPLDESAHVQLGVLALRAGDTHGAEAMFQRALDINPGQRDALNNLAAIYLERQDFAEALDLTTAALQGDPAFLEAAYNRGLALAALGRRTEAETVLGDVERRFPRDPAFDRYRDGIRTVLNGTAP
ncbi:MAG: tetratricopeptide repeat protein [Nitrospirota bacterium]